MRCMTPVIMILMPISVASRARPVSIRPVSA
jgi:hypothetical protein